MMVIGPDVPPSSLGERPAAPEVRAFVEALTGMKTPGVVERLVNPEGGFAYRLRFGRTTLICACQDGEWLVSVGEEHALVGVWRSALDEHARAGARLIDTVLTLGGQDGAVFQRQYVQAAPEVHRKSYRTGYGEVWLHTRGNERGTEGAMQLPDGRVFRYQWERATGNVLFEENAIDTVPF